MEWNSYYGKDRPADENDLNFIDLRRELSAADERKYSNS